MALRNIIYLLFFLCIIHSIAARRPIKIFNVINYGAVADGKKDNSQAFLNAWKDACSRGGRNMVFIPRGIFSLGSVTFQGYCKGPISFVIKGTLMAPTDPAAFATNTWIGFQYVSQLTLNGGGSLDGQGQVAWPYNDCTKNPNCKPLPISLRLDFVSNSTINHLRSINSKNVHINLFACNNVTLNKVRLEAPGNSPNTDGIHIGSSARVNITRSIIATGDDCIAMVAGSQDIDISGVTCGPGHGISIGSLGHYTERQDVARIRVRNCTFVGTQNGVRIKTWAHSLYSVASDMSFDDIVMENVQNPVVIDQHYCPNFMCGEKRLSSSAVEIRDVRFSNIRGTSISQLAVKMDCSEVVPCRRIELTNIDLAMAGRMRKPTTSFCSHVYGSSHGEQRPPSCVIS